MSADRFCIDTNVLFYAIDSTDERRHQRAVEIVERAVSLDCVVPFQVLCEFFASTTRKGAMTVAEAKAQVDDWRTLFVTVFPSRSTLGRAIAAVEQHSLSFWDALVWAVAKEAGVSVLLSEALQDRRELQGVRFRNPFAIEHPFG